MSDRRIHRVKIGKVTPKPGWKPDVTHHALLRYIERVHGIDTEALRDHLRTNTVKLAILFGARHVKREDCTLIIEDGKIVTVLGKNMHPKEKSKKASNRAERLAREHA